MIDTADKSFSSLADTPADKGHKGLKQAESSRDFDGEARADFPGDSAVCDRHGKRIDGSPTAMPMRVDNPFFMPPKHTFSGDPCHRIPIAEIQRSYHAGFSQNRQ